MPGQLIDVGGHRLHLHCTGSGSPTVVLEPGRGASSSDFAWIAPAVARDTTVCVYDRAGRGWSDASRRRPGRCPHRRGPAHPARRAHVPGPYVLAGHSFGGLYARASPPNSPTRSPAWCSSTPPHPNPAQPAHQHRPYNVLGPSPPYRAASAHLGAGRLLAQSPTRLFRHAPGTKRAPTPRPPPPCKLRRGVRRANASVQQAAALTNLNGKPLIVLTADEGARQSMAVEAGPPGHAVDQQSPPVTRTPPTLRSSRRSRRRRRQPGNPRRRLARYAPRNRWPRADARSRTLRPRVIGQLARTAGKPLCG